MRAPVARSAGGQTRRVRGLVVDVDGVLLHGRRPAPGLAEFVGLARSTGVVLLTNNSTTTAAVLAARLAAVGAPLPAERILVVGDALARYLVDEHRAGKRAGAVTAFVIGAPTLRGILQSAGVALDPVHPEFVVVGLDDHFGYPQLATATQAVRAGARLVAANRDPVLITEDGSVPATGAILAAIEAATGVRAEVVGKPNRVMFDQAFDRLGAAAADVVVIGDSLYSDIGGGHAAGARTLWVRGGVDHGRDPVRSGSGRVAPTWVVDDLAAATALLSTVGVPPDGPRT